MVINKTNLIHILKSSSGLSYRDVSFCVGFLIEVISDGISKGKRIELRGLGSFTVKGITSRKTALHGAPLVPAHGRIVFRPCEKLRRAVWDRGSK
ncbi:MAG: HU family DNA-binding protein [Spirochaetaceae bacterium]|jgi:nucleoid DNA-binding protein|nr:HU family DNA-binding protein [Spirochaetaceae bacterium]